MTRPRPSADLYGASYLKWKSWGENANFGAYFLCRPFGAGQAIHDGNITGSELKNKLGLHTLQTIAPLLQDVRYNPKSGRAGCNPSSRSL
jgi:hypothetical protein